MSDTDFQNEPIYQYDVALSFAGEDRDYVENTALILKSYGVKVFYDKFEEADLWGKDLFSHLKEVYSKRAKYTIIFISEHYKNKLWTTHERKSMQERAFRESEEYILPVRFDNTEIPGLYETIGYIDLTTKTPSELTDLVIEKLKWKTSNISPNINKKKVIKINLELQGEIKCPVLAENDADFGKITREFIFLSREGEFSLDINVAEYKEFEKELTRIRNNENATEQEENFRNDIQVFLIESMSNIQLIKSTLLSITDTYIIKSNIYNSEDVETILKNIIAITAQPREISLTSTTKFDIWMKNKSKKISTSIWLTHSECEKVLSHMKLMSVRELISYGTDCFFVADLPKNIIIKHVIPQVAKIINSNVTKKTLTKEESTPFYFCENWAFSLG